MKHCHIPAFIILFLYILYSVRSSDSSWLNTFAQPKYAGSTAIPGDTIRLWGYLSPYHHIRPYIKPQSDCIIDQVNILHRHGARLPELAGQQATFNAVQKYQKATSYHIPELTFLNNYSYDLGSESLIQIGAEQSWMSGALAYQQYASLIDDNNLPFVRSSLSGRVVMSASNWSLGFYSSNGWRYHPKISVYIHEGPQSNNTLFNMNCPNASEPDKQVDTWIDIFAAPISDRLNSEAKGLPENVTAKDAFYLMMMCPLESLYHREESDFCLMFTKREFEGFDYALDLEQYYKTGYGQENDLGRMQGIGYVNELLARLTNQPVKDETQTNHTLDDSSETFPLGEKMYVDFSHDHAMVAIYSALGLFNGKSLSPLKIQEDTEWITSQIVPFSARMSVERLRCTSTTPSRLYGPRKKRLGRRAREGEYVRILVNDGIQSLPFCGGDEDGLCSVLDFVNSQNFSRTNGHGKFYKCGYDPTAL